MSIISSLFPLRRIGANQIDRHHRAFYVSATGSEIPKRGAGATSFCAFFSGENLDHPQDGMDQKDAADNILGIHQPS